MTILLLLLLSAARAEPEPVDCSAIPLPVECVEGATVTVDPSLLEGGADPLVHPDIDPEPTPAGEGRRLYHPGVDLMYALMWWANAGERMAATTIGIAGIVGSILSVPLNWLAVHVGLRLRRLRGREEDHEPVKVTAREASEGSAQVALLRESVTRLKAKEEKLEQANNLLKSQLHILRGHHIDSLTENQAARAAALKAAGHSVDLL